MMTTSEGREVDLGDRQSGGVGIPAPDHRLSGDLRLGRVLLQVADLERSIDFYGTVLGLALLDRSTAGAKLGVAGSREAIVELVAREGATPVPRRGRLGLYHFAILLPDRAALGRLVTHLSRLGLRPGASDHLVSEALYLQDPDGLGIEVYADRPRSAWQVEDGQLKMDTRPLDLEDLVRAAGGETWTSAPAGTRLGHIHLHVSSIEVARDFYHRALGLDQIVWSYPGALFLSAGGYHHHLGVNTWAAGAVTAGEGDARLVEWVIVLPTSEQVAVALENLEKAGVTVDRLESTGSVTDPWGVRLRLRAAG